MVHAQSLQITNEILKHIAEIDEFKGAWRALGNLAPEQLNSLKRVATIESIGSSTRIEGSKLSDKEVEVLLGNLEIKNFTTRDQQEVAGYADVMNIIFDSYKHIPLTENYIQQLHDELLQYSEKDTWHRGKYKTSTNHVEAFDADGNSVGVVFETATPFETPIRMQELVDWANGVMANKSLHPILMISLFVVEFLAIHPFQDGNGRLSRVLTTFLMLKSGYLYTPYSSMEAVIEQSKERYYLALRQTQGTIKSDEPNWQPWVLFFLKTLVKQKDRLESKLEQEKLLLVKLPELSLKIVEIVKERGRTTNSDIVAITGANRNTVKKHLEQLVKGRHLHKHGKGKGTWYAFA